MYVGNDPINWIDPTGEFGIIGAVIGVGVELTVQLALNGGRLECIDIGDLIIAEAVGAIAPSLLSSGKTILRSAGATKNLVGQLGRARTENRANKIRQRINRNIDEAALQVSTQVVFQGGKAIGKSAFDIPADNGCDKKCGQ